MKVKLFGAIKVLIGLLAVLGGFILLYPLLKENLDNTNMMIGNLIGFTALEVYGLYVIYSGWTEFQDDNNLKRGIIWSGIGGSFFMFLVMLWVIKNDTSEDIVIGGPITLGLLLFIGIRDGLRLKTIYAAHNKSKTQVLIVTPGSPLKQ